MNLKKTLTFLIFYNINILTAMGYDTVFNASLSKMQMIQKIDGYITGELSGKIESMNSSISEVKQRIGKVNFQKLEKDVKSSVQKAKSNQSQISSLVQKVENLDKKMKEINSQLSLISSQISLIIKEGKVKNDE